MRILGISGSLRRDFVEGEVAVGHATDRFDSLGRLDDPNLEEQVGEVTRELLAEADATTRARLVA